MEDRIRKFMEYKGISPSELADSIDVQRSNVSHVLNGRNKPSFQFIEKMLQVYPEINAKWLLLGTGNMVESSLKQRNLFEQEAEPVQVKPIPEKVEITHQETKAEPIEPKKTIEAPPAEKMLSDNDIQDQFFSSEKPIERLVVFFKDQTFKVYNPSR